MTGDGGAPRSVGSSVRGCRGGLGAGSPSSVTAAVSVIGVPAFVRPTGAMLTAGGWSRMISSLLIWTPPPLFETSTLRSISHTSISVARAVSVLPLAVTVQTTSFLRSQSFGTFTLKMK